MKCTQYGLYRQAAFKNARVILFSKSGGTSIEHGLHPGSVGYVPKAMSRKNRRLIADEPVEFEK